MSNTRRSLLVLFAAALIAIAIVVGAVDYGCILFVVGKHVLDIGQRDGVIKLDGWAPNKDDGDDEESSRNVLVRLTRRNGASVLGDVVGEVAGAGGGSGSNALLVAVLTLLVVLIILVNIPIVFICLRSCKKDASSRLAADSVASWIQRHVESAEADGEYGGAVVIAVRVGIAGVWKRTPSCRWRWR
ncbi:hypothetical protein SCHPADRAFT_681452 [Schizopora paradoxa]|uniref:Uncharacterized protein n=1 Tax=Schizopora paradoxa TaxID=27342 RepID=A0A0H2R5T0_9AGAM|nr:hypothetical protein SCHPADRAFT_681452 [Schizopora paradoxa]